MGRAYGHLRALWGLGAFWVLGESWGRGFRGAFAGKLRDERLSAGTSKKATLNLKPLPNPNP